MKTRILVVAVVMSMFANVASANVLNPGFETGDFTDWFSGGTAVVVSGINGPSAPGDYAVAMSNAPSPGDIRSKGMVVTPGELYDFSVDYNITAASTGEIRAQVRWHEYVDLNGNAMNWVGESNSLLSTTGGDWATLTVSGLTAPELAGAVDIRISAGLFEAFAGDGAIDNVSLVPEPATLALLGLGGLLLRKRS